MKLHFARSADSVKALAAMIPKFLFSYLIVIDSKDNNYIKMLY
jgi:hypothetical protein